MKYQFAIIGGGIVGSSIAYHLALAGHGKATLVIEPDPTYEWAATPRSSGGVRQLFSVPENVKMSQYGLYFYQNFAKIMAVGGDAPSVNFRPDGYMFLASTAKDMKIIEANAASQKANGANVILLDRDALHRRFPSIRHEDIEGGVLSPDDGTIDPYAALIGFRRKATSLGVTYLKDRVTGFAREDAAIRSLALESGGSAEGEIVFNCANVWGPGLCEQLGIKLPIEPVKRDNYFFEIGTTLEHLPRTKDSTEVSFRPEGRGYAVGLTNRNEAPGFRWDVDYKWFENEVWPRLAHRVPAFEALKMRRGWCGLYDLNRFDTNPVLGLLPRGPTNFHVALGFSGHGIQAAPAIGRAMSELVLSGRFETLDLSRFGARRLVENTPVREVGYTS